ARGRFLLLGGGRNGARGFLAFLGDQLLHVIARQRRRRLAARGGGHHRGGSCWRSDGRLGHGRRGRRGVGRRRGRTRRRLGGTGIGQPALEAGRRRLHARGRRIGARVVLGLRRPGGRIVDEPLEVELGDDVERFEVSEVGVVDHVHQGAAPV